MSAQREITRLLKDWESGDGEALNELFPLIYDELYRMAHKRLLSEREGHTLSTTDLVSEAYLKLVDQTKTDWENRAHFLAIASMSMRRILVDHARKHSAKKRGGKEKPITFDESRINVDTQATELVDLNRALDRLANLNERLPKVVECRFFGGLTREETAEALDVSVSTVHRDWTKARAWLYRELYLKTE